MKITEIANDMIKFAKNNLHSLGADLQPYRRQLSRGLLLIYTEADDRVRLGLTRADVSPSEFEEQICWQAFDVLARVLWVFFKPRLDATEKNEPCDHVIMFASRPMNFLCLTVRR
jgi:hypothetical protein